MKGLLLKRNISFIIKVFLSSFIVLSLGCKDKIESKISADFSAIEKGALNKEVRFYGWGGSPEFNKLINTEIKDHLKSNFNINLKHVGMDANLIINKLLAEKAIDKKKGNIDVIWLNGENFLTAKKAGLLTTSILNKIPNYMSYADINDKSNTKDFGIDTEGQEVPFGRAQLTLAVNKDIVEEDISSTEDLLKVLKDHSGMFTYISPPNFTGSAFVRSVIYEIVGYEKLKNIESNKNQIKKVIRPALDYLNSIEKYLWQKGEAYPKEENQLHDMYINKQVFMTMTYTPLLPAKKVLLKEFPKNTVVTSFSNGNLANTHFLAIPFNAPNKDAAVIFINYLLSPKFQISKTDIKKWGDFTVLKEELLPYNNKVFLDKIKAKVSTNLWPRSDNVLPEISADKITIIEKLWEEEVLRK